MKHFLFSLLVAGSLGLVACSSGDDDDSGSSGSDSSKSSGGSESAGSSSGGGTKAECSDLDDCEKLTCNCGGLSGAEVRKCSNGVCAKTCEAAGCE